MTPEEAYEEAMRRILEAEAAGTVTLDLSGLSELNRLPPELERLAFLRKLHVDKCEHLRNISPLAKLTSLEELDLNDCTQLSDLSPLAGLTSLKRLDLCSRIQTGEYESESWAATKSRKFSDLTPLAKLTLLQELYLSHCDQLSSLSRLDKLTSLKTLTLSWCGLSNLSPLSHLTSLQTLKLSNCKQLRGDLSPLAALSSLQSLNLPGCVHLSGDLSPLAALSSLQTLYLLLCQELSGDLSPLAALSSLRWLNLFGCKQLSGDLRPLARLTSLRELDLNDCLGIRRFAPLESLLPTLKELRLFGCKLEDLPLEVCGEFNYQNVLDKVRAHYEDLKSGQLLDAEVKVLFLGNGGTGKSQLCRRLRALDYDPSVPSTHGIQLSEKAVELEGFADPVRLNLWDFGGQEIYHGSHALFLQGQAVFLILWTPKLEEGSDSAGDLTFRRRPLSYWLDYLRAFVGVDNPVLLIQNQCDTPAQRAPLPVGDVDDFTALQRAQVSAKTGLGLDLVTAALKEAVRDCLYRRPPPPIGASRVSVRDRLRRLLNEDQTRPAAQRQHRLLERTEFDGLCEEVGGISNKEALLDFLHRNGVVFYRPGLFGDRIVLDQNWALEAVYALFERKKALPLLRDYGRFSRADLEAIIWSDRTTDKPKYTPAEQEVFLGMMESCGICFKLRELPNNEWEYVAPELLPEWSGAQDQLLGRLREDPPAAEDEAQYAFLHEGVLRGYLSKIGQYAHNAPVYWKYGCWFYEKSTKSQVLIDSQWKDAANETGPGTIHFRAWGQNAESLIDPLLEALRKLPVGQPSEIKRIINAQAVISWHATAEPRGHASAGLEQLKISARSDLPDQGSPEIFVSYAWGDKMPDASQEARQRQEVVERMCETLPTDGWKVVRDALALGPGEQISTFMKRLTQADRVIVVLSDKYLHSPYCMAELYGIYQRSLEQKEEFLQRVIPLALGDARFRDWRDRVVCAKYWRTECEDMEQNFRDLGAEDYKLYKAMKDWHNHVNDMLVYVNVCSPRTGLRPL